MRQASIVKLRHYQHPGLVNWVLKGWLGLACGRDLLRLFRQRVPGSRVFHAPVSFLSKNSHKARYMLRQMQGRHGP